MHQLILEFAMWLNTIVPDSEFYLKAARFFFMGTILMTLWTGVRLCLSYPTVLAFWLATAPLPLVLAYYFGQLYAARFIPVEGTYGQLWANLSVGFAFAGYWTLLGMLKRLYREKYGPGRAGMRQFLACLRRRA